MQTEIAKQRIMDYVECIIQPSQVQQIELIPCEEVEQEGINIWLLEADTGEEYWVLEGNEPLDIFSKSGLLSTPQRALQAYLAHMEETSVEVLDRFHLN